jgi:hypothetical protein
LTETPGTVVSFIRYGKLVLDPRAITVASDSGV